jgi:hypothetical protein
LADRERKRERRLPGRPTRLWLRWSMRYRHELSLNIIRLSVPIPRRSVLCATSSSVRDSLSQASAPLSIFGGCVIAIVPVLSLRPGRVSLCVRYSAIVNTIASAGACLSWFVRYRRQECGSSASTTRTVTKRYSSIAGSREAARE